MHDRTGNQERKPSKDDIPEAFIVEPNMLKGSSLDRWLRFIERLKERDGMAVRPMTSVKVEPMPAKPKPGPGMCYSNEEYGDIVPCLHPGPHDCRKCERNVPPLKIMPPENTERPAPKAPPAYVPSLDDLKVIREAMAKHAHDVWMKARAAEKGWHNPKDCPTKLNPINPVGDCPLCHPCMVPYEELNKTEQDIDRAYPIAFLNILKDMGYMVVKMADLPQQ